MCNCDMNSTDELYNDAVYLNEIWDDYTKITNEIYHSEIKYLSKEELNEYDLTNLFNSLLNDTNINRILVFRYILEINWKIPLSYEKYPMMKELCKEMGHVLQHVRKMQSNTLK